MRSEATRRLDSRASRSIVHWLRVVYAVPDCGGEMSGIMAPGKVAECIDLTRGILIMFAEQNIDDEQRAAILMNLLTTMAAERRWTKAQLFTMLDFLYEHARPKVDAVFRGAGRP